MKIKSEELGIDITMPPIIQRDLEAFYKHLRADKDYGPQVSTPEMAAATVRAAKEVGWIDGFDITGLDDWSPAKAFFIQLHIDYAIGNSLIVPKDSSWPPPGMRKEPANPPTS